MNMCINNDLTKYVVTEELTARTTKAQMSAAKLYTAQGGRLSHLQIHKKML